MRDHMIGRLSAGLLGVALSFAIAAPASAATTCELAVSPAQTERDLSSAAFETPITMQNNGGTACTVTLSLQAMSHDLDGTPRYAQSEAVSAAFSVDQTSFTVDPGKREVANVSGAIPKGDHASYFAVLVTYQSQGQVSGTSVETRTQIASQYLLRGPKPWDQTTKVTDVGFLAGGDSRHRTIYATVKNLGNVHVRPTGTVTITQNGKKIGVVTLEKDRASNPPLVLPGLQRRFTAVWSPSKPINGAVGLEATINGAGKISKFARQISFVRGEPKAAGAEMTLSASTDGGPHVNAIVKNTGNQDLAGATVTFVAKQDGKFERERKVVSLAKITVGQSAPVEWRPQLSDGAYLITATVQMDGRQLDEKQTSLAIGALASRTAHSKRGLVVLLALFMVVLAASGSVVALRTARRA